VNTEILPDGHSWQRIADAAWADPLDPGFAERKGGRWNRPGSFPVLYLNEDVHTARVNLIAFLTNRPYEPEDLRDDTGPVLIAARLPRKQSVADIHSTEGLAAVGLPKSYPLDSEGQVVSHSVCQPIGEEVKAEGLRGVLCISANAPEGAGRELAWFPATARSHAVQVARVGYGDWFWGPRNVETERPNG
jgi:hypothetical protein